MKQPHYAFTWCCIQEGKQASLAADFSITQFKHLGRLLMVHGRNSYKRSAALSQFVIHRSLCISTMQVSGLSQGLFQWRGEKVKSKSKVLHFIFDATISSSENFRGLEIEVVTWVWKRIRKFLVLNKHQQLLQNETNSNLLYKTLLWCSMSLLSFSNSRKYWESEAGQCSLGLRWVSALLFRCVLSKAIK